MVRRSTKRTMISHQDKNVQLSRIHRTLKHILSRLTISSSFCACTALHSHTSAWKFSSRPREDSWLALAGYGTRRTHHTIKSPNVLADDQRISDLGVLAMLHYGEPQVLEDIHEGKSVGARTFRKLRKQSQSLSFTALPRFKRRASSSF